MTTSSLSAERDKKPSFYISAPPSAPELMDNHAKTIKPLPNHLLQVHLMVGQQGIFDIKPNLHLEDFSDLRDPDYFRQASLHFGAVTWPNGEDIAADRLRPG